ncbi:MAG: TIGR04255 family protein [Phycisphaerae bacterium]
MGKTLKNKPLVEAIFELRWRPEEPSLGTPGARPNYALFLGRISDELGDDYPFYEQLQSASIPTEMAKHLVQHRFRKAKDAWPLVQVGPGIITLNDTKGYTWAAFRKRLAQLLEIFFKVAPSSQQGLEIESAVLRYIDAIDLDFAKHPVLTFLASHLKTELRLPPKLFEDTGVAPDPCELDLRFAFHRARPEGIVRMRFARGQRAGTEALILQTNAESAKDAPPKTQQEMLTWLEEAHTLTRDWFFALIAGELEKRFE